MRRLPVYFLMDVSDSMAGEPIKAVADGMDAIVADLRNDPYALETMYVAVLVFAGKAEIRANLEELALFHAPTLPIGAGTSLGAGLNLLMDNLDMDVQKTTATKKGDWKPLIFLFTDGCPTDNPGLAIERWNRQYRRNANLVVVTFGVNADMKLLRRLTDDVLSLTDTTPASFRQFFRWVSASLQTSSMAVNESNGDGLRLAKHCINLDKAPAEGSKDSDWAVLRFKCSTNGKFWLAKYAKTRAGWAYDGACAVDEAAYTRLGGGAAHEAPLSFGEVNELPQCPICGANHGVLRCAGCGGLSCMTGRKASHCPWCGQAIGGIREVDNLQAFRSRG